MILSYHPPANVAALRAGGGIGGIGWDHSYPPRPHAHTARVRCLATGEVLERHHVDCRELIASGEYVAATP